MEIKEEMLGNIYSIIFNCIDKINIKQSEKNYNYRLCQYTAERVKSIILEEFDASYQDNIDKISTLLIDTIEETVKKQRDDWYNVGFNDAKKNSDDFYDGVIFGIKQSKYCLHCKKNIVESIHHIIPRKYGGFSGEENIIALCNKCHDRIEILTEDLYVNNRHPTIDCLKVYIENGFPNECSTLLSDYFNAESLKTNPH